MNQQKITCPECKASFPLDEVFSSQVEEKIRQEITAKIEAEKAQLAKEKQALSDERKQMQQQMEQKIAAEKKELALKAQQQAEEAVSLRLKDLEAQWRDQKSKLEQAEKNELELRKKVREVEDKEKNLNLELERKLSEEKNKIMEAAKRDLDEEHKLKFMEKEKQLAQMRKTIEDLKRKSEQGSMQVQGDAQEDDLKKIVSGAFPLDEVTDVPTGIRGADLVQTVNSQLGSAAGIILWESKNTKSWSRDWVKKAKEDQGIAKADVCILVTRAMPEGVRYFTNLDGIWVCEYSHALPLVTALRLALFDVYNAKQSAKGKDEKMEQLYQYLAGSQFKNKIDNIVMAFTGMKNDLESEKRAMQRIWNKREQEIEKVIGNTAGMYGDLQGIIGASTLPEVKSLSLPEGEDEVENKKDSPEGLF